MHQLSYLKPVRYLWRMFARDSSPRQVALGIALGMMIGLVPKGNLVAVGLAVLLFGLRVNVGSGLLVAFLVSLVSPQLDELTHGLGMRVLSLPVVYRQLTAWYELPLVPWTSLNNSVVMGGSLLGAALFYPVFHLSESLLMKCGPLERPRLRAVVSRWAERRRSDP